MKNWFWGDKVWNFGAPSARVNINRLVWNFLRLIWIPKWTTSGGVTIKNQKKKFLSATLLPVINLQKFAKIDPPWGTLLPLPFAKPQVRIVKAWCIALPFAYYYLYIPIPTYIVSLGIHKNTRQAGIYFINAHRVRCNYLIKLITGVNSCAELRVRIWI